MLDRFAFKKTNRLSLVGICVLLCECTFPASNIRDQADAQSALTSGRQSIVLGRIQWLERGTEKRIDTIFGPVVPDLFRMEDKSSRYGQVNERGEFSLALAPGTYLIDKITYVTPLSGTHIIYPKAAFRVPEGGKSYYVGSLRVHFLRIGTTPENFHVTVVDEGESGYRSIAEGLKLNVADVQNSILVQDQRLPDTPITDEQSFLQTTRTLFLLHLMLP